MKGKLLKTLQENWRECTACNLSKLRTNVVFGHGMLDARLVIIGEAPGEDEDLKGQPFVGKAGANLNYMLETYRIRREDVYITNTCLCRPKKEPTGNRAPVVDEIEACRPRLYDELDIIAPDILVLMGNTPYFMATGKRGGVLKDHGKLDVEFSLDDKYRIHGKKTIQHVFLTIHPASLLYGTKEQVEQKKAIVKEDWTAISETYHSLV